MRFVALVSGGKDSVYSIMECQRQGHELVAVAHLRPPRAGTELDSFMYQTVGSEVVEGVAKCLGVPLFLGDILGTAVDTSLKYDRESDSVKAGDEVESLHALLERVVREQPEVQAVSSGAILSTYQKCRVENVCQRLNLQSLSPLWRRDQTELLDEMIAAGLVARVIKRDKYQTNVCGEGGEYESLVIDCPVFHSRIILDETKVVEHSKDDVAPVSFLHVVRWHLEPKRPNT